MNLFSPSMQWAQNSSMLMVFFLSIRIGALLMMTPILYATTVPPSVRTLLILSLSIALAMGISSGGNLPVEQVESGVGFVFIAALRELALGAVFALGILVAFAAISIAGRLLDIQIGFGIAQVFDPLTRTQLPILTTAFNQLAVIFFFMANGHHTLLRAIAFSIERYPVGHAWSLESFAPVILKHVGILFSLGFALASPVVICVLLVELALGVVARNLPQMNMFVMGVPVKIIVGLAALSFWFVSMGGLLTQINNSIFQTWDLAFSLPASELELR